MELNEKLARWAGFEPCLVEHRYTVPTFVQPRSYHEPHWLLPDGSKIPQDALDFTSSLDAQAKWLWPKLDSLSITLRLDPEGSCHCSLIYFVDGGAKHPRNAWAYGETPAQALCKAIEQLIDKEQT